MYEVTREMAKGILKWYDFQPNSSILFIGNEKEAVFELLREKNFNVVCLSTEQIKDENFVSQYKGYFNYIVAFEKLEKELNVVIILDRLKQCLNKDGILLLGMNNRFGIKYFSGDRDKYTNRCFDGIEGYRDFYRGKSTNFQGRTYNKYEIQQMLNEAGFQKYQFYTVISDFTNATILCSENYYPEEDLTNRLGVVYNNPSTVFLNEIQIYSNLIKNKMFHQMGNAYFIECTLGSELHKELYVTLSTNRGKENSLITTINSDNTVKKKAIYSEGIDKLERLVENTSDLKQRGISVVEGYLKENAFVMPYIKGETGQFYLKRILEENKELFFEKMDYFRDLILKSSEIVEVDEIKGPILKRGYVDMVPLNCFYIDDEFKFFDQEFYCENYPAKAIIYRLIGTLYAYNDYLEKFVTRREMYMRYDLLENQEMWHKYEWDFLNRIIKNDDLRIFNEKYKINFEVLKANQQRINYSEKEYNRIFIDIFENLKGRKIVLFGITHITRRFISMYGSEYEIECIIDNNSKRWGEIFDGIEVKSPKMLEEKDVSNYKVFICIENCGAVINQIETLNKDIQFGVFSPSKSYKRFNFEKNCVEVKAKKYKVGYVAGVFDMFHVGHVNMLRRAKEQCEQLIVGIVSDEHVYTLKNKYPIIPEDERLEVIEACKYTDKAVILPKIYSSIKDAYKMFNFDCQFTGTDHEDNVDWLVEKEYLKGQGVDLVFIPYTDKTSSTLIREKLKN